MIAAFLKIFFVAENIIAVAVSSGGNITAGTRMKFHLRSFVLSAGLTRARGISDVSRCHMDRGKKKEKKKGGERGRDGTHGLSSSSTIGLSSFRGL